MLKFICKTCKKPQYSSAKTEAPCIYCGSNEVEYVGIAETDDLFRGGHNESKD